MAPESQPAQRGAVLKLTMGTIAEHAQRERIEAAMPAALRQSIAEARPSEWMPVEITTELMRVIHSVLGPKDFVAFYARQMERAQTDSAFGRFISGVTRLFARTPLTRLHYLPRGMDLAQRDCGEMRVEAEGDHAAIVEITGLPPQLRTPIYALSMEAPLAYAIHLCGHEGRVTCDQGDLVSGNLRFRVQWSATPVRSAVEVPGPPT